MYSKQLVDLQMTCKADFGGPNCDSNEIGAIIQFYWFLCNCPTTPDCPRSFGLTVASDVFSP